MEILYICIFPTHCNWFFYWLAPQQVTDWLTGGHTYLLFTSKLTPTQSCCRLCSCVRGSSQPLTVFGANCSCYWGVFYDDDGFGNIYGNFPDALQVSQVLMNTNSNTGTHTPTLRQTRKYVCMFDCMSEYQMQHERTRKYTHIKKQNKCRKLTPKCMWHNSKNCYFSLLNFTFSLRLSTLWFLLLLLLT